MIVLYSKNCGESAFHHSLFFIMRTSNRIDYFKIVIMWLSVYVYKMIGRRVVLMDPTFYTGYRRTVMRPEEVLIAINIPYTAEVSNNPGMKVQSKIYYSCIESLNPALHTCLSFFFLE